jgi:hypothetical protein
MGYRSPILDCPTRAIGLGESRKTSARSIPLPPSFGEKDVHIASKFLPRFTGNAEVLHTQALIDISARSAGPLPARINKVTAYIVGVDRFKLPSFGELR